MEELFLFRQILSLSHLYKIMFKRDIPRTFALKFLFSSAPWFVHAFPQHKKLTFCFVMPLLETAEVVIGSSGTTFYSFAIPLGLIFATNRVQQVWELRSTWCSAQLQAEGRSKVMQQWVLLRAEVCLVAPCPLKGCMCDIKRHWSAPGLLSRLTHPPKSILSMNMPVIKWWFLLFFFLPCISPGRCVVTRYLAGQV